MLRLASRAAARQTRHHVARSRLSSSSSSPPSAGATALSFLGRCAKITAGVSLFSAAGVLGYARADEGRWRSARVLWLITKINVDLHVTDAKHADASEEERARRHSEINRKWAPEVLALTLDLGGYILKLAQTVVGTNYLPDEYSEALEPLLDSVPAKPFSVVRDIVEAELGRPLDDVFATFDPKPLGAASIGQVHLATLRGSGKEVVVKVQYPDVKRFFDLDFRTMKLLMASMGSSNKKDIEDMMDSLSKTMQSEFDYRKEAAFLRAAAETCTPVFPGRIYVPLPIDASHADAVSGVSLCTEKILTMERVAGEPIRKHLKKMTADWAAKQGKSLREVKEEMKDLYEKNPKKLKEALSATGASETAMSIYIAGTRAINWLFDTNLTVPLNGPRILQLLADVHAHQVFFGDFFNSDPHAGNILQMDDGRLGLIDYGACDSLTHRQREAFAKLLIALADEDDDATITAFQEFGFRTKKSNRTYLLAYANMCYHRGLHPDDMARVGVDPDVPPMQVEMWLDKLDSAEKFEGHMATTQRCVWVLLGLARDIGAGSVSIARMWRPFAVEYLKSRGNKAKQRGR
eukprot:g878.t1